MATRNRTYTRPMLEVYQMLEVTRDITGNHLFTCILGAGYDLYRYGFENLPAYKFTATEQDIPFVFAQDPAFDYDVDTESVSVYAEGLEASLAKISPENDTVKQDKLDYRVIRLAPSPDGTTHLFAATTTTGLAKLAPALGGFGVEIGDIVMVTTTEGSEPKRRQVIGLEGRLEPSTVINGTGITKGAAPYVIGTDVTCSTEEGGYTGAKNTTYILTVDSVTSVTNTKLVKFLVTDTEGVETASWATVNIPDTGSDPVEKSFGTKGLKVKITPDADKEFTVGDSYSFVAMASYASSTEFDGLKLSASPTDLATWDRDTAFSEVEIRKEYSGKLGSAGETWVVTTSETTGDPVVHVIADAALVIPGREVPALFVDGVGYLKVAFRVQVIPGQDEDVFEIHDTAEIEEKFGVIAPENDLAYACACALKGSAGRMLYAIRTRGVTPDDFVEAAKKTEADDAVYAFCPVTSDQTVMHAVAAFNEEMSQPWVKKWRQTMCGIENIGRYMIADHATDASGGVVILTATFTPYGDGSGNCILQVPESTVFDFTNITFRGATTKLRAGDLIRNGVSGDYYKVKSVMSEREVLLQHGPVGSISIPVAISVWKEDTSDNNVEYIGNAANALGNRRNILVWCDHGMDTSGEASLVIPNKFLAAEVAGLSSAVVPQQGLTRTEISSITAAPRMYTRYTQNQLDEIASYGVLIVTQDTKGKPCYIRHQLTTDAEHGALYAEMSCTRNLDNISYHMVDILESYIGKANVTPSALNAIRVDATAKLIEFQSDTTDAKIGPSLVDWDGLEVYQDPKHKDRVIMKVNLYLPLPLNGIRLYEMAWEATVNI